MASKTDNFLNKIKDQCIANWTDSQILPSVTAAQAILESGWGSSELAVSANNLFGVKKGTGWKGETYTKKTTEYSKGKPVQVSAIFRKYPSWGESIKDRVSFFKADRYKKALGETDYTKSIQAIKDAGYATDPEYVNKIVKLIELYKLAEWDKVVLKSKPKAATKKESASKFYIKLGAFNSKEDAEKVANQIKDTKLVPIVNVIEESSV